MSGFLIFSITSSLINWNKSNRSSEHLNLWVLHTSLLFGLQDWLFLEIWKYNLKTKSLRLGAVEHQALTSFWSEGDSRSLLDAPNLSSIGKVSDSVAGNIIITLLKMLMLLAFFYHFGSYWMYLWSRYMRSKIDTHCRTKNRTFCIFWCELLEDSPMKNGDLINN